MPRQSRPGCGRYHPVVAAPPDRRRVVVLLDHDWVENQAFARETIAALASEGFTIDLVARATDSWTEIPGVRYLSRGSLRGLSTQALLARLALDGFRTRDCAFVLATPPMSVVAGYALARTCGAPLIVLHDELWTSHNTRVAGAMYRAHERAALTIITDARRVPVLVEDWPALASQEFVELPNCPAGVVDARPRDEVRAELGIPADAFTLLNAGSLTPAMGLHELLGALPRFPADAFLVCQSGVVRGGLDPALLELVEARYPVRFRLAPLPYDRVDDLVAACDVGIALYPSDLLALRLCGKGSGKLSRYLRAGKPVIVDRNANLDFVADYGAAEVVKDASGIPDAIRRIAGDYDRYAAAATKCYEAELSFETHWPVVREAIGRARPRH